MTNREIKFRVWDKIKKRMLADIDLQDGITLNDLLSNPDFDFIEYTGLKDKNGVEIYDGDIVSMHQFLFDGSEIEREHTGVVSWDGLAPSFTYTKIYTSSGEEMKSDSADYTPEDMEGSPICCFYGLHEESFTIIGNLYEHPHLLEAEQAQ